MKIKLQSLVAFTIILFVSSAMAGITLVPIGVQYVQPEVAPISVSRCPGDFEVARSCIRIRTTGLHGVKKVDCTNVPECQPTELTCADIPFTQQLELDVDRETGVLKGRTRGN